MGIDEVNFSANRPSSSGATSAQASSIFVLMLCISIEETRQQRPMQLQQKSVCVQANKPGHDEQASLVNSLGREAKPRCATVITYPGAFVKWRKSYTTTLASRSAVRCASAAMPSCWNRARAWWSAADACAVAPCSTCTSPTPRCA